MLIYILLSQVTHLSVSESVFRRSKVRCLAFESAVFDARTYGRRNADMRTHDSGLPYLQNHKYALKKKSNKKKYLFEAGWPQQRFV